MLTNLGLAKIKSHSCWPWRLNNQGHRSSKQILLIFCTPALQSTVPWHTATNRLPSALSLYSPPSGQRLCAPWGPPHNRTVLLFFCVAWYDEWIGRQRASLSRSGQHGTNSILCGPRLICHATHTHTWTQHGQTDLESLIASHWLSRKTHFLLHFIINSFLFLKREKISIHSASPFFSSKSLKIFYFFSFSTTPHPGHRPLGCFHRCVCLEHSCLHPG